MKYIVFLRGIMPTGKNKLKMADLRELLNREGYHNVGTYLQSGNLILDSDKDYDAIGRHIHQAVKEQLGPELPVVVKTVEEVQAIVDENPYKDEKYNNSVSFCAMYQESFDEDLKQAVEDLGYKDEYIEFGRHALFYYLPNGAHRSKITNNLLERKLKTALTSRNQNTMEKVLKKALGQ